MPIGVRTYNSSRIAGQRGHVQQTIYSDARPHAIILIYRKKVTAVEQIPLTISILKGMGINAKGLICNQNFAYISKWSKWIGAGGDAQLMIVAIDAMCRVIQVERSRIIGHFGCPEFVAD